MAIPPTNDSLTNFIPLPAEPDAKLTLDELLSIFAGKDRLLAERDLLRELARTRVEGSDEVA